MNLVDGQALASSLRDRMYVVGIDEVGMGCWAGPMVIAAAVVPVGWSHPAVRDSKKYSKTNKSSAHYKRMKALKIVKREVFYSTTCRIKAQDIDSIGVNKVWAHAVKTVISRCMKQYSDSTIVIDGEHKEGMEGNVFFRPKADRLFPAVSAASVVAKVARDSLMKKAATIYPGYGFESNVGYGTKQHEEALQELGLCPLHRRSYLRRFEPETGTWQPRTTQTSRSAMRVSIASRMQHKRGLQGNENA